MYLFIQAIGLLLKCSSCLTLSTWLPRTIQLFQESLEKYDSISLNIFSSSVGVLFNSLYNSTFNQVIEDFASENVVYIELRTTPKVFNQLLSIPNCSWVSFSCGGYRSTSME